MKYYAQPVIVDADVIISIGMTKDDGSLELNLREGGEVVATPGMVARYIPKEGDYYVTQEDGYIYINPKSVFERKYAPINGVKVLLEVTPADQDPHATKVTQIAFALKEHADALVDAAHGSGEDVGKDAQGEQQTAHGLVKWKRIP